MRFRALFVAETGPRSTSFGLLILRIFAGLSLLMKHGLEKLTGYPVMVQHFPDPIHIGAHASLAFALLTDGICSALVIAGLATRAAAALIFINIFVAYLLVHHALYFSNDHLEAMWLYLAAFATLVLAGPGRFSLDARIQR
jgi:putative oxidoreductase